MDKKELAVAALEDLSSELAGLEGALFIFGVVFLLIVGLGLLG